MDSYESLFCFNLLPLPKKLVPKTTNAKNIWRADWGFLLVSTKGFRLAVWWRCGGSISQIILLLLHLYHHQLAGRSVTEWLLCARHSAGPLKNYLTASCAHWKPKWLKEIMESREGNKGELIFFSVKFLSSGFLPLFLKFRSFAKWDEFIVFLRSRTELEIPTADLELSESKPDAQIKSASCPEQWLLEATGWFIWLSWSFPLAWCVTERVLSNTYPLPRLSHSSLWLGKRAVFFSCILGVLKWPCLFFSSKSSSFFPLDQAGAAFLRCWTLIYFCFLCVTFIGQQKITFIQYDFTILGLLYVWSILYQI